MYKRLIDKEAVKLRCSRSGRNMYDLLTKQYRLDSVGNGKTLQGFKWENKRMTFICEKMSYGSSCNGWL